MSSSVMTPIQVCLDRLRAGDSAACESLIALSQARLRVLTRRMLGNYPEVHRWEQTDDVLQKVLLRIDSCLREVRPRSTGDFVRLAAELIRRQLLDLLRHYKGPLGLGTHYVTPSLEDALPGPSLPKSETDPISLLIWTEFHQKIDDMPREERETFELIWYQGLSQVEAAALAEVSEKTIKRRWQKARLLLAEWLQDSFPPIPDSSD